MTDKQPAPVGDCHIAGKAVVPEEFSQLEAVAKRLQEALVSASIECAGKQQEALSKAMEAYLEVSTPSVMLSLLQQNADLKAKRDALADELNKRPEPAVYEAEMNGFMSSVTKSHYEECKRDGVKTRVLYTAPPAPVVQVPESLPKAPLVVGYNDGWDACLAEVLRLNSQG